MDWGVFAAQWIHVFLGIFWLGSVLAVNFILIPGVLKLPFAEQRRASEAIGRQSERVILPVSALVIVFGVLRGTVFGSINDLGDLSTPYGLTWLASLVLGVGLFFWGLLLVGGSAKKLVADDAAWTGDGPNDVYMRHISRLRTFGLLELVGFVVLLTLMILMRFGVPL